MTFYDTVILDTRSEKRELETESKKGFLCLGSHLLFALFARKLYMFLYIF